MSTRAFPTPAVITAATGRFCCDIDDLYNILGWVLDDVLMTHQLPAAARCAEPFLRAEFPWLDTLHLPPGGGDDFTAAVFAAIDEHGPSQNVPAWPDAPWKRSNALADLAQIADGRPIITVEIPKDGKA